jgi:hypothetical protein
MTTFAKSQTPFGRPAFSWTLCLIGRKKKREYRFILIRRTINNMITKKKYQIKYK